MHIYQVQEVESLYMCRCFVSYNPAFVVVIVTVSVRSQSKANIIVIRQKKNYKKNICILLLFWF